MSGFMDTMQQQLSGALGSLQGVSDRYQQNMGAATDQTLSDVGQWRNGMAGLDYNPQIGALRASAAMLGPTMTGGFGESLGGALNALGDSKEKQLGFQMDKFDKMARMDEAIGKLRQHKAGLEYDTLGNNVNMMGTLGNQNNNLMNQQFTSQLQPYKIDALQREKSAAEADANFQPLDSQNYTGADGQFDYAKGAQATYQDYLSNPQKYAGPQGQKMVSEAMQVLQQKQQSDTQLEAAGIRANRNGKGGHDVGTMKAIREKIAAAGKARMALSKTSGMQDALAYAATGPISDLRMRTSAFFGDEKSARALAAIDQMGLLGLEEVSQYLKPMSEADATKALNVYGDPSASIEQKLQAYAIVQHGMKLTAAWEEEEARAMKAGEYYLPDYNPLNNPKVRELFEKQGPELWGEKSGKGDIDYSGVPDEVRAQAEEAIAAGKDPVAVKAMIEEMRNGSK